MTLTPQILVSIGLPLMLSAFLFLALRQQRYVKSLFDYHLYGNDLKPRRFSASLVATSAGLSSAFVLILYYGFLFGPWVFPFVWIFWLLTEYTSRWTIKQTNHALRNYEGGWDKNRATLHQFLGLVFHSPRSRRYAGILSLICYLGVMAAEIVLAMHLLAFLVPNHQLSWAFFLLVAIMMAILIYNVLSGFRGTIQTDIAQLVGVSCMLIVVGVFVVSKSGYLATHYAQIFTLPKGPSLRFLLNPDGNGYLLYLSFIFSNLVFWAFWWPGAMDQWQRTAAAREKVSLEPTWGTMGWFPVLYFGVLSAIFVGAGVWLRLMDPNAALTPDLLQTIAQSVQVWGSHSFGLIAGTILVSVVILGLLCAAMATLDGYVMTASNTLFVDIVHYDRGSTLVDLSASDEDGLLLRKSRAVTIIIPFCVIVIAACFRFVSDVFPLIYFAFGFMFALLPPLFAGLMGWGREDASRSSELSLIAGGICALSGALIIEPNLEHAVRINNALGITICYQLVYWWPAVITIVGGLVLWLNWPRSKSWRSE